MAGETSPESPAHEPSSKTRSTFGREYRVTNLASFTCGTMTQRYKPLDVESVNLYDLVPMNRGQQTLPVDKHARMSSKEETARKMATGIDQIAVRLHEQQRAKNVVRKEPFNLSAACPDVNPCEGSKLQTPTMRSLLGQRELQKKGFVSGDKTPTSRCSRPILDDSHSESLANNEISNICEQYNQQLELLIPNADKTGVAKTNLASADKLTFYALAEKAAEDIVSALKKSKRYKPYPTLLPKPCPERNCSPLMNDEVSSQLCEVKVQFTNIRPNPDAEGLMHMMDSCFKYDKDGVTCNGPLDLTVRKNKA